MKYSYWVYGTVDVKDYHIDIAFRYNSNHKFNSDSIVRCAELLKEKAKQSDPIFDDHLSKVVIKFFGKLDD